jgi:hypothetical protein
MGDIPFGDAGTRRHQDMTIARGMDGCAMASDRL